MKSRLPEIAKKLPAAVAQAEKESATRIARQAAANVAPLRRTGALEDSLRDPENVRPVVTTIRGKPVVGWGIYAQWYWFLVEFGHMGTPLTQSGKRGPSVARPGRKGHTGPAAPHPFLIPAAEAERAKYVSKVRKKLGDL